MIKKIICLLAVAMALYACGDDKKADGGGIVDPPIIVNPGPTPPPPPAPGCKADSECQAGFICQNSVCIETPPPAGCTVDTECGAGLICKDGSCAEKPTQTGCQADTDCEAGYVCKANACVPAKPNPGIIKINTLLMNGYNSAKVGANNFVQKVDLDEVKKSVKDAAKPVFALIDLNQEQNSDGSAEAEESDQPPKFPKTDFSDSYRVYEIKITIDTSNDSNSGTGSLFGLKVCNWECFTVYLIGTDEEALYNKSQKKCKSDSNNVATVYPCKYTSLEKNKKETITFTTKEVNGAENLALSLFKDINKIKLFRQRVIGEESGWKVGGIKLEAVAKDNDGNDYTYVLYNNPYVEKWIDGSNNYIKFSRKKDIAVKASVKVGSDLVADGVGSDDMLQLKIGENTYDLGDDLNESDKNGEYKFWLWSSQSWFSDGSCPSIELTKEGTDGLAIAEFTINVLKPSDNYKCGGDKQQKCPDDKAENRQICKYTYSHWNDTNLEKGILGEKGCYNSGYFWLDEDDTGCTDTKDLSGKRVENGATSFK
jgi:hypothetical protein